MDKYGDLKPHDGERVYFEWDDEYDCFGVFGDVSGFCYGQYSTDTCLAHQHNTCDMCAECRTDQLNRLNGHSIID